LVPAEGVLPWVPPVAVDEELEVGAVGEDGVELVPEVPGVVAVPGVVLPAVLPDVVEPLGVVADVPLDPVWPAVGPCWVEGWVAVGPGCCWGAGCEVGAGCDAAGADGCELVLPLCEEVCDAAAPAASTAAADARMERLLLEAMGAPCR
jgi:hypothetical protein